MYEQKTEDYFRSERTELIRFFGRPVESVLDIGCGAGANAGLYRDVLGARTLAGIEIVPDAALEARERFDVIEVGPVEETLARYAGRTFDLIVCADVLEHLADPWEALRQMKTVSHPGTALLCSLPNLRNARVLADLVLKGEFEYREAGILDRTHLRFFTKKSISGMLRSTGWPPERWSHNPFAGKTRLLHRASLGRLEEFLVTQYYVVARNG